MLRVRFQYILVSRNGVSQARAQEGHETYRCFQLMSTARRSSPYRQVLEAQPYKRPSAQKARKEERHSLDRAGKHVKHATLFRRIWRRFEWDAKYLCNDVSVAEVTVILLFLGREGHKGHVVGLGNEGDGVRQVVLGCQSRAMSVNASVRNQDSVRTYSP